MAANADTIGPGATAPEPAADMLLLALVRLCRQLGRPVSEAELRASAAIPATGADLACLGRLADRLGFMPRIQRLGRRALARLPVPFLVVNREAGKAWLVRARTNDHLVLVEPVNGETTARTLKAVAGLGDRIVRLSASRTRAGLWHVLGLCRLRGVLWQVGLASVVINLVALATPLFMMTVYNKVISHGALRTLDILAVGMATLLGFELLLRVLRGYVTAHAGARLEAAIGGELVHHILGLPYRQFEAMPGALLVERMRQLDQLRQFLTGQLPLLLVDLGFVGLFLAALLVLSPALALVTAAVMPLFVLLSILVQRRQARQQRTHALATTAKATALGEIVAQTLTVKALALEPEMERRFEQHLVRGAWSGLQAGRVAHMAGSLGQCLQHLAGLALVYVGARMIVAGELSIGALIACSILSARALAPTRQIAFAWTQLQQAREAVRGIAALFAERTETEGRPRDVELGIGGHFRLEAVRFAYPEAKRPALDGVSLELVPGTMLGVVGAPGSGKSTLVRLLLGLEVPQEGQVLLDGTDLGSLPPAAYRGLIGVVPQEIQLFAGTVAENIGIGAPGPSRTRIVAAARFVGADEFIRSLPQGYDTVLGERGSGLSQGQRQLVAIARAVVRNPRVLILDEATSALDPAAEAYLLANIRRASSGRTVVLITHRPAVLEICDTAVLLEQGRIARRGPPREIALLLRPQPGRPGRQAAR